jgi:YVTN family beta-propeller protein
MIRTRAVSLALSLAAISVPAAAQVVAARAGHAPAAAPAASVSPVESTAVAPFPNFESGPVRPLLLTPDGALLLALNTPDARLEVFSTNVDAQGAPHLHFEGAVLTGLEPVSLALHDGDPNIVFVANQLSDTVTVVDLGRLAVQAVLPVGDEPQDVAVANGHLFVTTARSATDGSLTEPGTFTQNAVVALDAAPPYGLIARTALPADRPRALAVDGGTIYVAPQNSGNHTTCLDADQTTQMGLGQADPDAFDPPFSVSPTLLVPQFSGIGFLNQTFGVFGWEVPQTGRIVMDSEFPGLVPQLADNDVLALDVATGALLPGAASGVGTTLLAMARNPATGDLWVAGTDAHNRTRFESNVKGAGFDNRVTVVAPDLSVKQIVSLAPPLTSVMHAQPAALAFLSGPAGRFGYVATLGDDTVVVLDAMKALPVAELKVGPQPAGLAADGAHGLLYVLCRGDQTLSAYDAAHGHAPIGRVARLSYDPEPQAVSLGRHVLYAAAADGAGNGNMSCASCHVFGHADQLAWDLGDPQGGFGFAYQDLMTGTLGFDGAKVALKTSIMTHPMKGPMTTQSLRGLGVGSAVPLHWRGDRRFIQMFRGAFAGLLGGTGLSTRDMQDFAAFLHTVSYPPNPYEPKDRVYTGTAAQGRDLFGMNPLVPGKDYNPLVPNVTCIDCHQGNFSDGSDFSGSQVTINFDGETQLFNAAGLRGVYEKEFADLTGFGTLHDGSLDDIEDFLHFSAMGMMGFPSFDEPEKQAAEDFVRAWDTGTAPLVGAERFASAATLPGLYDWLDLAEAQASSASHPIDLIGKGRQLTAGGPQALGLHFTWNPDQSDWMYRSDTGRWSSRGPIVAAIANGLFEVTFACVPPGTGERLGIDRDEDGLLDGIEVAHLTNPASPDTDGDGYADGLELQLGSNAAVFDPFVPDSQPPTVQVATPQDVFTDTATLHVVTDEPSTLVVDVGIVAGTYDLASFTDGSLRREHDLSLVDLPALSTIFFRVTALDRNGNPGLFEGQFLTAPPLYRVADVSLDKSGNGTVTLTATVLVVDQAGTPIVDAPVRGIWAGPLGGGDFFPLLRTDATGVATFVLGPYAPGPDTVTFGVAYVGTNETADPFFIGFGGDSPKFFYNQSANSKNSAAVAVP